MGLRTAALKGARAAVDGARAAVDVALAEPADGASLDPEADPAGWAAALALLNDTVAAHSSLGELLPKMREMVSNCREAWLASNRPSAESGGVEAEAQAADTALTRELGEAFEAIREAVGCAVTPVSDVVLEAVEPDWAAVLNESEEQNSGGQAGTRALHEALLSAREGMCVVVPIVVSRLSTGAALHLGLCQSMAEIVGFGDPSAYLRHGLRWVQGCPLTRLSTRGRRECPDIRGPAHACSVNS